MKDDPTERVLRLRPDELQALIRLIEEEYGTRPLGGAGPVARLLRKAQDAR